VIAEGPLCFGAYSKAALSDEPAIWRCSRTMLGATWGRHAPSCFLRVFGLSAVP
jgi:hypothetical protein